MNNQLRTFATRRQAYVLTGKNPRYTIEKHPTKSVYLVSRFSKIVGQKEYLKEGGQLIGYTGWVSTSKIRHINRGDVFKFKDNSPYRGELIASLRHTRTSESSFAGILVKVDDKGNFTQRYNGRGSTIEIRPMRYLGRMIGWYDIDGKYKKTPPPIKFNHNDGGRAKAGRKGRTGDCVCRAICIATGLPYEQVYKRLAEGNATQRMSKRTSVSKARTGRRTASYGIFTTRKWFKDYMRELGFEWTPTMHIGSGCTTHLKSDELPKGRLVVNVSKHLTSVIDGVLNDTYDCSRNGTRCVYGYWKLTK